MPTWLANGPGKGRPKGSLNKTTLLQREVAEKVLGKPGTPEFEEFIASQRKQILLGILPPVILQMWMHYLVGKPKETIEVQGEVTTEKVVREVIHLPDADKVDETSDAVH